MLLSSEEVELFYKLHSALMQFVQEQLKGSGVSRSAAVYSALSPEKRHEVAQAFLGRLDLIDAFIAANPTGLSEEELGIVSSWRHLVAGRFIALRQLKKHMILLACDGTRTAYGATGLVDPMARVIPQPLPAMIETVLLPFRGKIVYHGIVNSFNVTFGPGTRRRFEEEFRTAKATSGVVTSLAGTPATTDPRGDSRKTRPIKKPSKPVGEQPADLDLTGRKRFHDRHPTTTGGDAARCV